MFKTEEGNLKLWTFLIYRHRDVEMKGVQCIRKMGSM